MFMCFVFCFVFSYLNKYKAIKKAHDGIQGGRDEKWRLQQVRIRCKMEVDPQGMESRGVNGEQSEK